MKIGLGVRAGWLLKGICVEPYLFLTLPNPIHFFDLKKFGTKWESIWQFMEPFVSMHIILLLLHAFKY